MAIDTLGANALASNSVTSAKIAADALSSDLGMQTWVDFVRKEQ